VAATLDRQSASLSRSQLDKSTAATSRRTFRYGRAFVCVDDVSAFALLPCASSWNCRLKSIAVFPERYNQPNFG
jgi:hypothetical protein